MEHALSPKCTSAFKPGQSVCFLGGFSINALANFSRTTRCRSRARTVLITRASAVQNFRNDSPNQRKLGPDFCEGLTPGNFYVELLRWPSESRNYSALMQTKAAGNGPTLPQSINC